MGTWQQNGARTALLLLLGSSALTARSAPVAEYQAEYEVSYNGRRVAAAEFSVTASAPGEYLFASSTRARGLLRLASPGTASERSAFRLDNEQLAPLRFDYDDGSRKGEDSYSVVFDTPSGAIEVDTAAGAHNLPAETGLLDRGSLQVALMRDLAECTHPGPYRYVDDESVNTYEYERLEDLAAETGIGTIATVRFAQQREGSSRRTILWLARDYAYVPVRIEQIRDGEVETVFLLEALSGISPSESACSGFR